MQLICSLKFCISIVFNFSWDGSNTQEINEKQRLCKFWGACTNKVHYITYGRCAIGHFTVMDGSEAEGARFDTNLPALSCKSIYSYTV